MYRVGQLRRLQELLFDLRVSAVSDDGLIEVIVNGGGEVQVELHDGALTGQSEKDLARKLNHVIGDAMWQFGATYRDLSARTLGLD